MGVDGKRRPSPGKPTDMFRRIVTGHRAVGRGDDNSSGLGEPVGGEGGGHDLGPGAR
jgi:hypothetical protein